MDTTSVVDERRTRRILEEAVYRFNNELMDDSERLEVLARIKRLRRGPRDGRGEEMRERLRPYLVLDRKSAARAG
jgi:hypothetical protein